MPSKIFISYRRQDSAANALGIGQYLEHEFGRKNVFIDVDMRAGTKFPAVLEQRLAECKVMLVLIGPDWLNAKDEHGHRRLDDPNDWVRLEIAHALRRNITVIPVRVNGTELPSKKVLPEDIQGLLDHQAVSVTIASFRNDMSGLVRDIRSIPNPRRWGRSVAIAAGVSLGLALFALYQFSSITTVLDRFRPHTVTQALKTTNQNGIWSSSPGEWVMYATDQKPVAYYFRPSSVRFFGDRVVYLGRIPFKTSNGNVSKEKTYAAYEDDVTIIDCKKSTWTQSEKTIYNGSGEVLSHFKKGDPASPDLPVGEPINPGSILSAAEYMFCNDHLRTPISQQLADIKPAYLAPTVSGDGDIFYGPVKKISGTDYQSELLFFFKFHEDHKIADFFPGQNVVGLPISYRNIAEPLQLNCRDRKVRATKIEYLDQESNLIYVFIPVPLQPIEVKNGSPFDLLLNINCDSDVGGTYDGTVNTNYKNGGESEQKVSITVEQNASAVNVSFQAGGGGQGKGSGTLDGDVIDPVTLQSTTPGCPGSYEGSIKFVGDTVNFSYSGKDCGGEMEGHGTATRTKN